LPVSDEEDDEPEEPVMSSEEAILDLWLKGLLDAVLLPAV
jgi:hypothetical protein